MRRTFAPLALALVAATAVGGGLDRYKDWKKSPEFVHLATEDEQKAWKGIRTDEEAERFVRLFWARRDPDLATAANEFEIEFERRVEQADKLFSLPSERGALTERGKLLIILGPPKELKRIQGTRPQPIPVRGSDGSMSIPPPNEPGTTLGEHIAIFTYEAQQLPDWARVKSLVATFVVEATRDYAARGNSGEVQSLEALGRTALVRNPDLKEPPHVPTAAEIEAGRAAAALAAEDARKGPALAPAVRQALEEALSKPDEGSLTLLPVATRDELRLHVQLFVPAAAGTVPAGARLAVLVKDDAGRDAARSDEVTTFARGTDGTFFGRSFAVPAGAYTAAAGLFDPAGTPLRIARAGVSVPPAPAGFALGRLLVASAVLPAPDSKVDDAFAFSGFRFVSKAGRLDPTDGLNFVVRVYNPAVDPATRSVHLSRTVKLKPKGQPTIDIPQPEDAPIPVPERKGKEAEGPLTVDVAASLIESNLGAYLSRPGDYDLKVAITDLIAKTTAEATATFTVTGTLKAPAAAK